MKPSFPMAFESESSRMSMKIIAFLVSAIGFYVAWLGYANSRGSSVISSLNAWMLGIGGGITIVGMGLFLRNIWPRVIALILLGPAAVLFSILAFTVPNKDKAQGLRMFMAIPALAFSAAVIALVLSLRTDFMNYKKRKVAWKEWTGV